MGACRCARHCVVHEGAGEELAGVVEDERLAERAAEALGDAAVKQPSTITGLMGRPAVVHGGELEKRDRARFEIDLEDDACTPNAQVTVSG